MTARRRARTGQRRDGGIRTIRTSEIRYPGVKLPASVASDTGEDVLGASGLRPARDTGLALTGRLARENRRQERRRRRSLVLTVLWVVGIVVLASGWKYSSDRAARVREAQAARPAGSTLGGALARTGAAPQQAAGASVRALNGASAPTPYFAKYKQLKLRLPVSARDVTEVGFHQASYSYARHMTSLVAYGDADKAKKRKGTSRDISKQSTDNDAVLTGTVLKMWRSRPGKPDTAVDVGADAGVVVYAPIDGVVVKVKAFDLYGKYPDVEIHIQPDGYPNLDVVMIHVDDVVCAPGDRVIAGVTPLAAIRDLDARVRPQLRSYTDNGGTHTHMQVNDATHPKYKGLKGAIRVSDLPPSTP